MHINDSLLHIFLTFFWKKSEKNKIIIYFWLHFMCNDWGGVMKLDLCHFSEPPKGEASLPMRRSASNSRFREASAQSYLRPWRRQALQLPSALIKK